MTLARCPQCEDYEARIEALEEALGIDPLMVLSVPVKATPTVKKLIGLFVKHPRLRSTAISVAIWGGRPDSDVVGENNVSVTIHKVRKVLAPLGIKIEAAWGEGYYMDKENHAKLVKLVSESQMAGPWSQSRNTAVGPFVRSKPDR